MPNECQAAYDNGKLSSIRMNCDGQRPVQCQFTSGDTRMMFTCGTASSDPMQYVVQSGSQRDRPGFRH